MRGSPTKFENLELPQVSTGMPLRGCRTAGFSSRLSAAVLGMACWVSAPAPRNRRCVRWFRNWAPHDRRATAFGIFNAVYGAAWFAGSILLGVLYDRSVVAVAVGSVALQAAALPVLFWLRRRPTQ
jgi:predicted MFS family arabinose efflux permease